jgi:hypothetical protein
LTPVAGTKLNSIVSLPHLTEIGTDMVSDDYGATMVAVSSSPVSCVDQTRDHDDHGGRGSLPNLFDAESWFSVRKESWSKR